MPLLVLLSPFVFLMSAAGLAMGPILAQAISAVATWTAAGYLAGFAADRR